MSTIGAAPLAPGQVAGQVFSLSLYCNQKGKEMKKFKLTVKVNEHNGPDWTIYELSFTAPRKPYTRNEALAWCGLTDNEIQSIEILQYNLVEL